MCYNSFVIHLFISVWLRIYWCSSILFSILPFLYHPAQILCKSNILFLSRCERSIIKEGTKLTMYLCKCLIFFVWCFPASERPLAIKSDTHSWISKNSIFGPTVKFCHTWRTVDFLKKESGPSNHFEIHCHDHWWINTEL